MTPKDWPRHPTLKCRACGKPVVVNERGPIHRPNGDEVYITICADCWLLNDYVNGEPVDLTFVITRGTQPEVRTSSTRTRGRT